MSKATGLHRCSSRPCSVVIVIASRGVSLRARACHMPAQIAGRRLTSSIGRSSRPGSPVLARSTLGSQDDPLPPSLVVFSGGTAFNSIAGAVRQLTSLVTYVLPVSDDGGSTAEIVRVLGGPAVGDIRSRCLRLADDSDEEARAVKQLLGHRLDSTSSQAAKAEWYDIVEGQHPLWQGVSEAYKHTIRSFLVHFHTQLLHHTTKRFDFRNGSVGNFLFAGARLFVGSLEAAIFLFSRVARIPEGSEVMPAICTEEPSTLGAQLADGTIIRGQNAISHPDAGLHMVRKGSFVPLSAPVRRVFYLSNDIGEAQHEVKPGANPAVLARIETCSAIVYGIGSLFTSICPTLVLQGVGEAIAACQAPKIFLLNGSPDREVCYQQDTWGPVPLTQSASGSFSSHSQQPDQDRQASGAEAQPEAGPSSSSSQVAAASASSAPGELTHLYRRPGSPTVRLPTHRKAWPALFQGSPAHAAAPQQHGQHEQREQQEFSFSQPPARSESSMRCMTASEMVLALCDALNRRQAPRSTGPLQHRPSAYVTALVVPEGGAIDVDREQLAELGIQQVQAVRAATNEHGRCTYDAESLVHGIAAILDGAE